MIRNTILLLMLLQIVGAQCGAGLLACGRDCYKPDQYCCKNGVLTQIQFCGLTTPVSNKCPPNLLQCGRDCYKPDQYCCKNGVLTQIKFCGTNPTPPNPVPVNPSRSDVTVVNNCKVDLYVEARMDSDGRPLPGYASTRHLPVGQRITYQVPDTGAVGTRFWAKYGCNTNGTNCLIGDSMQYWPNPPGGCPPGGCQIPIDSLFEATFGCRSGTSCHSTNPTTWFNLSQVDGWTIPYRLNLYGETAKCDCAMGKCTDLRQIDGSKLDLSKCPTNEDASAGLYPTFNGLSTTNLDLRVIRNGTIIGCMSPCKRLTYGAPYAYNIPEGDGPALYMCCPTPNPNDCKKSEGCILPTECSNGPIVDTKYVQAVHKMAPNIYAYSYDDGVGLHTCPAGSVQYEFEFCPSGSVTYPVKI